VRLRNAVFMVGAAAAAVGVLRRRAPSEYVDVHFEDGSSIRLTRGPEANDLLDDAYAILHTLA
jgi:hypothetical protein